MSYVEKIVHVFGGVRPMARAIQKPPTTVQGWKDSKSIPDREKPRVMEAAGEAGIVLKPEDFFPESQKDAN